MLVAEKQLLDASLRNDLMLLRRMEIKMIVERYETAIPAATLIAGFSFTGVVEMGTAATSLRSHPQRCMLLPSHPRTPSARAVSTCYPLTPWTHARSA